MKPLEEVLPATGYKYRFGWLKKRSWSMRRSRVKLRDMARKGARVSLNDDRQRDEPAHRADAASSASSGGNADAGAARSHVHSVRPVGSIVGERFVLRAHLGRGR